MIHEHINISHGEIIIIGILVVIVQMITMLKRSLLTGNPGGVKK